MIAQCVDIRYVSANMAIHTFGRATVLAPSRLLLIVHCNHRRWEIDLAPFFKHRVGRLTERRRDAIKAAMPKEIEAEEYRDGKGMRHLSLFKPAVTAWLQRCAL